MVAFLLNKSYIREDGSDLFPFRVWVPYFQIKSPLYRQEESVKEESVFESERA